MKWLVICILLLFGFTAYAQQGNGTVIVVEITGGSAQIRHGDVSDPLAVGEEIPIDQVIEPVGFARVTVLCPSQQRDIIDLARAPSCAAESTPPVWQYGQLEAVDVSRGVLPDPHIITPRNTRLRDGRPHFSWTLLPDAHNVTYRLSVIDSSGYVLWIKSGLTSSELDYPLDEPPLRALDAAGNTLKYIVQLEVYDSAGILLPTRRDGLNYGLITIASPSEQLQINADLDKINTLLPNSSAALMLEFIRARYLAIHGFYADALQAIANIEAAPQGELSLNNITTSPTLYALSGDVFSAIKLPDRALAAYQHSLEISQTLGNFRGQAYAFEKIAPLLNRRNEQLTTLEDALNLYTKLGEVQSQAKMYEQIAALTSDLGEKKELLEKSLDLFEQVHDVDAMDRIQKLIDQL